MGDTLELAEARTAEPDPLPMQITCCWCKGVMVEGDPARVSHGLHRGACEDAYRAWAGCSARKAEE